MTNNTHSNRKSGRKIYGVRSPVRAHRVLPKNRGVDRRFLPKPQPLIPKEDAQDEAILERYNIAAQENQDLYDKDDPELAEIDAQIAALQEKKGNVIQLRIDNTLRQRAAGMEPEKVIEYCREEPWKKGGLSQLSKALFGFVPEKFELLASQYEEGSEEHTKYMDACIKAREIYDAQLKAATWDKFSAARVRSSTRQALRGKLEILSKKIDTFARTMEGDSQYSNQYGRVRKAGQLLGYYFMDQNGMRPTTNQGDRIKIELSTNPVPDVEDIEYEDIKPDNDPDPS